MTDLENSVLKTVVYADIFRFPMIVDEIVKYLMITGVYSSPAVTKSLTSLLKKEMLSSDGTYVYLPGRSRLVALRKKREIASVAKFNKAMRIARILSYIPSIQAVFLTGAVAMQNAEPDDDIDVMIITDSHTLWSSRLMVSLLLSYLRVRRHADSIAVSDLVCANLYLDTLALAVPRKARSVYTAHEVLQVKVLFDRNQMAEAFLKKNSWVWDHLATPEKQENQLFSGASTDQGYTLFQYVIVLLMKLFNEPSYWFQLWYMRSKRTTERIDRHAAYFHPRDSAGMVARSFRKRCLKLGL